MSRLGANIGAHATPSTASASVKGTHANTDTSATGALGSTPNTIVQLYIGIQGALGMGTKRPAGPRQLAGSNEYYSTPPTPINLFELEKALLNHPDSSFVSSLLSCL